jgi:hypothetical protein
MFHYPDPEQRDRFVAGLRALAEFIESSPGVPAPWSANAVVIPLAGDDAEKRAEVDAIADLIGAQAHFTHGGTYTVSRRFGPVEYRAVAISHDDESE